VPAYVVLNDRELAAVAEQAPTTMVELAACKGMGPIRLERWGDDILAVVEEASAAVTS
jgi:DNA helicase-2/ATP-dependent DNA helicase PcrA